MDGRTVDQVIEAIERERTRCLATTEEDIAALRALAAEVPDALHEGDRWLSRDAARMRDVTTEVVRGSCEPRHDDPVEIVARPCFVAGRRTIHYAKEYRVADAVPGRIEVRPGWAEAMRSDGLSERVVQACRERIAPARE